MVQRLFPLIHDDKIDLRTRELRDYLCDPKSLNRELDWLKLAPSDVLDNATAEFKLGEKETMMRSNPRLTKFRQATLSAQCC